MSHFQCLIIVSKLYRHKSQHNPYENYKMTTKIGLHQWGSLGLYHVKWWKPWLDLVHEFLVTHCILDNGRINVIVDMSRSIINLKTSYGKQCRLMMKEKTKWELNVFKNHHLASCKRLCQGDLIFGAWGLQCQLNGTFVSNQVCSCLARLFTWLEDKFIGTTRGLHFWCTWSRERRWIIDRPFLH
jgi:hypothetical protein